MVATSKCFGYTRTNRNEGAKIQSTMPCHIPPQDFAFFCDESGISQDKYTGLGGICVHKSTIPEIQDRLDAYRNALNMHAELKWSKISDHKFSEYQQLVEYFYELNRRKLITFHCIFFERRTWKKHENGPGFQDIGVSKLYYQLIHHRFSKYYGDRGSLFVCMDHRNSSTSLNDLRGMLNNAARRDYNINENPIKQIVSSDSKKEDMLQINDVILGAVTAVRNGKHLRQSGRKAKKDIAEFVLTESGLSSFSKDTPRARTHFTVWNFKAKGE